MQTTDFTAARRKTTSKGLVIGWRSPDAVVLGLLSCHSSAVRALFAIANSMVLTWSCDS